MTITLRRYTRIKSPRMDSQYQQKLQFDRRTEGLTVQDQQKLVDKLFNQQRRKANKILAEVERSGSSEQELRETAITKAYGILADAYRTAIEFIFDNSTTDPEKNPTPSFRRLVKREKQYSDHYGRRASMYGVVDFNTGTLTSKYGSKTIGKEKLLDRVPGHIFASFIGFDIGDRRAEIARNDSVCWALGGQCKDITEYNQRAKDILNRTMNKETYLALAKDLGIVLDENQLDPSVSNTVEERPTILYPDAVRYKTEMQKLTKRFTK